MATQVQNRRGTTAEHSTFTGAVGEVTIDTDKDTVVVHDGATAGGHPLMKETGSQNLTTSGNIAVTNQGDLRLGEATANGSNYVALQAPAALAADVTYTLPDADGTSGQVLSTNGSGTLSWATAAAGATDKIEEGNTSAEVIDTGSDGRFVVTTEGSERARVDSSGRLLVGTSSARSNYFNTTSFAPALQVEGAGAAGFASIVRNDNTNSGLGLILGKSRSSSYALVSNADPLGVVSFQGADGSELVEAARIEAYVDGTPGANDMPGRLVFSTTADGASSPTERMRIAQDGRFYVPGVWTYGTSVGTPVVVTSDNQIRKDTSSIKYKTAVETLEDSYADQILDIRPVYYRSMCKGDNPNHSHWGFIAEEVAKIDPRLVTWSFHDVSYDEEGKQVVVERTVPEPEGVAYSRFVPHLLNLIKRQKEQIESQGASIAALEARLSALESA